MARRVAAVGGACLALLAGALPALAAGGTGAPSTPGTTTAPAPTYTVTAPALTYTVSDRPAERLDSTDTVRPMPTGFVGVSMDYCAITEYADDGANPVLAHLLLGLSPQQPVIRIGGNGPDDACPHTAPRPVSLPAGVIAAVARRTGAKLILGVNLLAHSLVRVINEVRGLVAAIEPRRPFRSIEAFEIGNEPDLYPQYSGKSNAPVTEPYFGEYLADFTAWAEEIRLVAEDPDVGIAGPSLGRLGLPWITGTYAGDFGRFLRSRARPTLITFHSYPLHGHVRCPASDCPTIPNLLLDRSSLGLAAQLPPFVELAGPQRVVRVDEMNSVTGGGVRHVSNTFASALWALNTMFELARAGVSGVNVHTFPGARYELYNGPKGGWRVFPEYYGLLAFERAAPAGAQLLAVSGDAARRANPAVKVWATRTAGGRFTDVVINRSNQPAQVSLSGSAVPARSSATIAWLTAPASGELPRCPPDYGQTGLCAIDGVTLGGATFGATAWEGGDRTTTGILGPPRPGTCTSLVKCTSQPRGSAITLTMPGGSAVLVSGVGNPDVSAKTDTMPDRHG